MCHQIRPYFALKSLGQALLSLAGDRSIPCHTYYTAPQAPHVALKKVAPAVKVARCLRYSLRLKFRLIFFFKFDHSSWSKLFKCRLHNVISISYYLYFLYFWKMASSLSQVSLALLGVRDSCRAEQVWWFGSCSFFFFLQRLLLVWFLNWGVETVAGAQPWSGWSKCVCAYALAQVLVVRVVYLSRKVELLGSGVRTQECCSRCRRTSWALAGWRRPPACFQRVHQPKKSTIMLQLAHRRERERDSPS
jgi:hypothetical protein